MEYVRTRRPDAAATPKHAAKARVRRAGAPAPGAPEPRGPARPSSGPAPGGEPPLGATSFALLAQFARQPASAYALASAMRRNLHYLWPRAESRIYAEVQRLQQRGLVHGVAESTGRRARTVMHVTPAGHAALAAWMAAPVTPGLALESEALLRVYFATLGGLADIERAFASVEAEADELLRIAADVGEGYLAGRGIAQEQAHVRAMVHALLGRLALLLKAWVDDCRGEAARWADLAPQGKAAAAARRFRATQELLVQPRRATAGPGAEPGPAAAPRARGARARERG